MRLGSNRNDDFATIARQRSAHFHVQRARLAGLAAAFEAAGTDWDQVPVVERFDHSIASGATAAARLLDHDPQITSLICTSDILALGALEEARRRGLRVPQDITITGFDGIDAALKAGVTTVDQPILDKGREAGKLLLGGQEPGRPRTVTLTTKLVLGNTAARPHTAEERWFGP